MREAAQDAVLVEAADRIEQVRQLLLQAIHFTATFGGFGGRIELRFEQLRQDGGDPGVRDQHLLHVRLAEARAGLNRVTAVGAQHGGLTPGEIGDDDQLIEAVVLGAVVPHRRERIGEAFAQRSWIDGAAVATLHLEVLQPDRLAARHGDAIRALAHDHEAHVLQDRQGLRQSDGRIVAEQAQVHGLGLLACRGTRWPACQAHRDPIFVGDDFVELTDVLERDLRRRVFFISSGEGGAILLRQQAAVQLAMPVGQGVAQLVVPGADGFGDQLLQLFGIDARSAIGGQPDDHVHARQCRLRQLDLRLDGGGFELLVDHRFHLLADLRVVAVAWHEDERGIETTERVPAQEHAHALALVQIDDAAHGANQVGDAGLEQLVARIRFDHMHDGLAVMAGRIESEVRHHAFDLVPKQRNLARTAVVNGGHEQAEETSLAGDAALRVDSLDADIVEIRRAMHRRNGVRLGDHQQFGLARTFAQVAGEHCRLGAIAFADAQNAKAGFRHRHQQILAAASLQLVLAIAEEGEVVGCHPVEQRLRLACFVGLHAGVVALDLVGQFGGALAHLVPVLDREAHILERA